MDNQEFAKKREKWLQEVSDECHEFSKKIDLDFYVFQTPSDKYNPDLLIVGINPGGGKTYAQMKIEKGYDKRPATELGYDTYTIYEKPQWEIDLKAKGADKLRSAFSRVFNEETGLKDVLKNSVMMNMFYFNTQKAKDIGNIHSEIQEYCIAKTIEFIKILNPKNIIFLTSQNWMLKKCGVNSIESVENYIKKGVLNNKVVYAIPHYGYYSAYSYENGSKMGKSLKQILSA